jgi:hypothetical protein
MKPTFLKTTPRPILNEIPLAGGRILNPGVVITMRAGQWDNLLAAAYDTGATLLELDDDETPIKAYRRWKVVND